MVLAAPAKSKINTEITQLTLNGVPQRGQRAGKAARRAGRVTGDARESTRDSSRAVVEVGWGVVVYPPAEPGGLWRAVFTEGGVRRYRQAGSEADLAVKLEKVIERLASGAPGMERPGAELIAHYLDPDRLPAKQRWSRRHADTQARLCRRFAAPVISEVACQDITAGHMQQIVNAAPTASEGDRLRRCLSALVTAGINAGYLTSSRLAQVHWQAAGRALPEPPATAAGESALWVDPADIPATTDVTNLARALGCLHPDYELMACTAAYTGLRQGELFALTTGQVDTAARVITVNRKLIEVAGRQYIEPPKNRKHRKTIYPVRTPGGYPLASKLAARAEAARAEQAAGTNPLGLIFPSPRNKLWRTSNFDRRVLAPAYHAAGWRDTDGHGTWTWHSLRHVFCTTALFTWKLDPTDVSRMAGHANYRITLEMYLGTTAGILDRARQATQ
jgi:integrase